MKKEKSPFFKDLMFHISKRWHEKKGMGYPFMPWELSALKRATCYFPEWQLMALYDNFIESESDWVKNKSGYTIPSFLHCLNWLVDTPEWRDKSKRYAWKIAPIDPKILKVMGQ